MSFWFCTAKELGVPLIGSFRCLNGKVDLSTYEAEHTVEMWESKLQKLRQELAVRTIARNITRTQAPYAVKVLAYQNGSARDTAPQIVIGSSITGVCCMFSRCCCNCSLACSSCNRSNDHHRHSHSNITVVYCCLLYKVGLWWLLEYSSPKTTPVGFCFSSTWICLNLF